MNSKYVKKILFLAANPKSTPPLSLTKEFQEIREGLQNPKRQEHFELEPRFNVRPENLQQAFHDVHPQIVHFSGHGLGTDEQSVQGMRDISSLPESANEPEGLVFEDDLGQVNLVNTKTIAELFKCFADEVECVVLNACYSEKQAEAIAQHIPYVIGMNRAVGDTAARAFAVSFYVALGEGKDIEKAFELARNMINLKGISEELRPVLFNTENSLSQGKIKNLQDYPPRERLQKIIKTPLSEKLLKNPRRIGYRKTRSLLVDFIGLCMFLLLILPPLLLFILFSVLPKLDALFSSILVVIVYICFALFLYHLFGNTLLLAYNNLKKGKEYTKIYDVTIISGFILEKQQNEFIQHEKTVLEYLVFTFEDLQGNRYKINQETSKSQFIQINDTGFAYLRNSKKLTGFMIDDFVRINSSKEYENIFNQLPK
jgi:CHAT domain